MSQIWRYMDLWKFESLIKKNALFFSKVAMQTDKLEGIYPLKVKINRRLHLSHLPEDRQAYALHNQDVMEQASKDDIIVSCWHINDAENDRMWNEYIANPEGIAIQSSTNSLNESFSAFSHSELIFWDNVTYVNRLTFRGNLPRRIDVFFQKEESFQWENELRFAIDVTMGDFHKSNAKYLFPTGHMTPIGYFVPVHLETLIEKITISPDASPEFADSVKELCRTHGIAKPIERSTLS